MWVLDLTLTHWLRYSAWCRHAINQPFQTFKNNNATCCKKLYAEEKMNLKTFLHQVWPFVKDSGMSPPITTVILETRKNTVNKKLNHRAMSHFWHKCDLDKQIYLPMPYDLSKVVIKTWQHSWLRIQYLNVANVIRLTLTPQFIPVILRPTVHTSKFVNVNSVKRMTHCPKVINTI